MVQEGRGHAAIDVWAIGEAALWSVSLVCGAGGDRAPSRSGLLHAGGSARRLAASGASTISRELRRNALPPEAAASRIVRRQRNGTPSALLAAQQAKLARQRGVKNLCPRNGWLASLWPERGSCSRPGRVLEKPSARTTEGPVDGQTPWSPEQIARRLPVDFADDATMRISHEAIYQALFVQGSRSFAPRTDGLPAHRARVADAEGAHARARQGLSSLPRS